MSTHIPGPWLAKQSENLPDFYAIERRDSDGTLVGDVCFLTLHKGDVGRATARLIASAPDLLSALIECVSDMQATEDHYGEHPRAQEVMALARAAIAKATGEQA
jgi:hypothetical protein